MSVSFLDLERLTNVNDELGHAAGDEVLRAVAHRLRGVRRCDDVLVRLGGDEFVASIVTPISDPEIDRLTERLDAALAEPIVIEGVRLCLGASIGVMVADHHAPRQSVSPAADPVPPRRRR